MELIALAKRALVGLTLIPALAWAERTEEILTYSHDGKTYEARLIYDNAEDDRRPGVLIVPNWLGPTDASADKAWRVAGDDYVVMMVDMYGVDTRPSNSEEAGKAAAAVRADRAMMRERVNKALEVFRAQADTVPLNADQIAAIGFCFGGGVVLEQARSGADLAAVVSFHGNLDTPDPDDAAAIRTPILVLHGADDPYVPQSQVDAFIQEMQSGDVDDWQLHQFGGAVHSFTNPHANQPGQTQYNPRAAERAFEMMHELFENVFDR